METYCHKDNFYTGYPNDSYKIIYHGNNNQRIEVVNPSYIRTGLDKVMTKEGIFKKVEELKKKYPYSIIDCKYYPTGSLF